MYFLLPTVTPLDVVKIRLQSQQQPFRRGSCFIYHNGLMDHLCVCSYCTANGNGKPATAQMLAQRLASCPVAPNRLQPWYNKSGHFNGTMVCSKLFAYQIVFLFYMIKCKIIFF